MQAGDEGVSLAAGRWDERRTCGWETMSTEVWWELGGGSTEQRWERVGLQEAGERRRDGRFLWSGCCKLIQSSIVKKTNL